MLGGPLDVLRGLRRLLFWQVSVPLSLTLLVGWQWLVSYPHLTPAAICFALAMVLQHSLHLNGERTESKGAFGRDGDPANPNPPSLPLTLTLPLPLTLTLPLPLPLTLLLTLALALALPLPLPPTPNPNPNQATPRAPSAHSQASS